MHKLLKFVRACFLLFRVVNNKKRNFLNTSKMLSRIFIFSWSKLKLPNLYSHVRYYSTHSRQSSHRVSSTQTEYNTIKKPIKLNKALIFARFYAIQIWPKVILIMLPSRCFLWKENGVLLKNVNIRWVRKNQAVMIFMIYMYRNAFTTISRLIYARINSITMKKYMWTDITNYQYKWSEWQIL